MLSDKVALVTGASRGIGYQSALTLARSGAHVLALARTVGGLEDLDDEIQSFGGSATLIPVDLLDFEAINRLGASIHERWGKLDILVGNAGMLGGLSPIEHFEAKTFKKTFELNVHANWHLICSLSPLLRASECGRIIFLTSSTARENKPFWGLYASTQSALQSLVQTWAAENVKTDMRINLLDPGPMRTALRASAMPGEDKRKISEPSEISDALLRLVDVSLSESGRVYDRLQDRFQA